ncbi:MAG: heparinase II/III-family protein [Planctomycetes bacterium]|nr:heparinase II/III-family protein [Planctomycetota bacterium]
MNRYIILLILGLLLYIPAGAGEPPVPGLEILDSETDIDSQSGNWVTYPVAPDGSFSNQTMHIPQALDQDGYLQDSSQILPPAYQEQIFSAPAYNGQVHGEPYFTDSLQAPAAQDPLYPSHDFTRYPVESRAAVLADLNVRNSNYPGLDRAVAHDNLREAADIVWNTLREQRIINATMNLGPGGSAGRSDPHQMQLVLSTINNQPLADQNEEAMRAAQRINIALDSFMEPMVDDYSFGSAMEQILLRLHSDIAFIHSAIPETEDEAAYLEMTRTYIRAAVTCDFFIFPNRSMAMEIDSYLTRFSPLFYPDGASIAGDVAGVTGKIFQSLLRLDSYTKDDSRFSRRLGNFRRLMEKPARHVIALAGPDSTLPRFGPRDNHELTASDVKQLQNIYPKPPFRTTRIGLAASHSYPESSGQKSYGGIFASRSGVESNAQYSAIRFAPMGIMRGVPGHQDFGSITLISRGIHFLVDPAGYGGAAAEAASHSVLSLDEQFVLPSSYSEPGQPVDAIWHTNASFDYASDQASFADGKTWQRTLVYIKDLPGENRADYWVILDAIDMKGDSRPRQARIRFQMAPGIQFYNERSGILASANFGNGPALRFFAIDADAVLSVSEGHYGLFGGEVFDVSGGTYAAPAVVLNRTMIGDNTTVTLLYPGEDQNHKPVRIERDSDLIRGRTGAIVIDHGRGRLDVIAWAPPGFELVTPTMNLVMSADLGIFRIRNGNISRMNFVNLERFQAKEPGGGIWSLRVTGPAQTLTFEPERNGGWQILSDSANAGGASLQDINLGPAISGRNISIRPGEMRVIAR